MKKTRIIVMMGLLIALDVIASSFLTIRTPIIKIGVSFIPVSFTGIIFGPLLGGTGAAIADILQCFLTAQGALIPGITFDAFLSGAVYGYLLHGKKPSILRCFIAAAVCELLIGGLMTTFWIYLAMPGNTFIGLFLLRIVRCIVMTPVEAFTIFGMWQISLRTKAFNIA